MTQPTEQEVVLAPNCRPAAVSHHYIPGDRSRSNAQAGPSGVLRSVVYPSDSLETLALRVQQLQQELAEQKQFADERVSALLEDRRIREMDHTAQLAALQATNDDLMARLKKLQASEGPGLRSRSSLSGSALPWLPACTSRAPFRQQDVLEVTTGDCVKAKHERSLALDEAAEAKDALQQSK